MKLTENQVTAGNPTQLESIECDKCHEIYELPQELIERIMEAKKQNPEVKSWCPRCSSKHLATKGDD